MDKDDPLPFTPEAVTEVLTEGGVPVEKAERIQKNYEEYFEDTLPDAKELLDPKIDIRIGPGGKESASGKGGGPDKEAGRGRCHRKRREGSRHRRQGFPRETASGYPPPLWTGTAVWSSPWMTTSRPASTEKSGNFKSSRPRRAGAIHTPGRSA